MTRQESRLRLWFDSNCMTNKRWSKKGRWGQHVMLMVVRGLHNAFIIENYKTKTVNKWEPNQSPSRPPTVARENKQDETRRSERGRATTRSNALDCSSINPKGSLQNCPNDRTVSLLSTSSSPSSPPLPTPVCHPTVLCLANVKR